MVTGDGDGLSIGTNHLIHALRRNVDLKILLFNNRIYGLTKGQYSPTSEFGKRTKSSPLGTIEQPIRPIQTALAAQASFVARTLFADPAHLAATLEAAARHRGAAFIEILQNCRIFNDGAFDAVADRTRAEESRILLRHGQPLRFGKGERFGLVVRAMEPAVVDLEAEPARLPEVLVHNAQSTSPALAALLAELEPPQFPTALGIFRQIERPTYEELLMGQICDAVARRGPPNLQVLLQSGTTWVVE